MALLLSRGSALFTNITMKKNLFKGFLWSAALLLGSVNMAVAQEYNQRSANRHGGCRDVWYSDLLGNQSNRRDDSGYVQVRVWPTVQTRR